MPPFPLKFAANRKAPPPSSLFPTLVVFLLSFHLCFARINFFSFPGLSLLIAIVCKRPRLVKSSDEKMPFLFFWEEAPPPVPPPPSSLRNDQPDKFLLFRSSDESFACHLLSDLILFHNVLHHAISLFL